MKKVKNYYASRVFAPALLIATMLLAPNATAQTGSFVVGVSGSASVLAYADDPAMLHLMQMQAGWVFGNELDMAFNAPALQISNDAASLSNIVRVEMTIGDDRFNFMDFPSGDLTQAVANSISPVSLGASVTTSNGTATSPSADNADCLVLAFGNGGLAPGDVSLFNIKIAFDSDFSPQDLPLLEIAHLPSFQRVLFDANGINDFDGAVLDPSTSDNSMVFVTYEDPVSGKQRTADPVPMQDFTVRPPVGNGIHEMPIMDPHFIAGRLEPIPEPAALVLLLTGITGIASMRRRSR